MIAVSCENLGISFGADEILKNVTFSVNEGDRVGIVGANGVGKSTLLRLIAGKYSLCEGSVYIKKGATVGMLEQNDVVDSRKTPDEELLSCCADLLEQEEQLNQLSRRMEEGDENAEKSFHRLHDAFMRSGGYEFRGRVKGILRSLGFDEQLCNIPCENLSGGQKTRLALAKILFRSPDILILDEPTNHLDTETLSWLEDFLRTYRKTVLAVSHDRYFLDRVANRILDVEHGGVKLYDGNYTVFAEKKKNDRLIAERHYRNQQREIARIEAYIEQQRRWNRERNIIAAESRQKMLDRMELLDKPEGDPKEIRLSFKAGIPSGEDVLKVKNLAKAFDGKRLFKELSFDVQKGDRLFIIGHNGCGKSTLMKILMNRLLPDEGVCVYGYNLTVGYYDQENQNLSPDNTLLDELWNTDLSMTQTKVRCALALFNFTGDDVCKRVSVLSGGERARLTFSKLVTKENNLLLLDEPTNHLDIVSKEVLEEALANYDGTVVAVSHDRYFINKLANCILDFDGLDGKITYFRGNYEEYLRFCCGERNGAKQDRGREKTLSENKKQYLENRKNQSELRKARAKLEKCRKAASEIEEKLGELSALEENYQSDYLKLSEIFHEREVLEEKLLELYSEIENLENAKV